MPHATADNLFAAIVGAGPCGSYVGHLLSQAGVQNTIFEDNSRVGVPEQCTGLFSTNMERFVKLPDEVVLNKIKGAVLRCGAGEFYLRTNRTVAHVTDRTKFDLHVASMAQASGSVIKTGHRYLGHEMLSDGTYRLKMRVTDDKGASHEESVTSDIIVGADGPRSAVAKEAGLWGDRKFWLATQTFLDTKSPWFEKDMVYLFFDKAYHQRMFAWVVPMTETTAKVGLASIDNPAPYFARFLADKFGDAHHAYTCQGNQGGLIPIYKKIPLQNGHVFLNGDAALQVKATTGGGVIKGFLAAEHLRDCIVEKTFDYDARLADVHRSLGLHRLIRDRLNRFSDQDYVSLFGHIDKPRVKSVLEKHGDMDFPHKFAFRLLAADPLLLRFLFK